MNIDLDKLKQAAQAATPGEWKYFPKRKYGEHHVSVPSDGSSLNIGLFPDGCPTDRPKEDAEYIAAVQPAVVLELIAELERAHARIERAVTTNRNLERDALQMIAALVYEAGGKATIGIDTYMFLPDLILTRVVRPDMSSYAIEFSVSKRSATERRE